MSKPTVSALPSGVFPAALIEALKFYANGDHLLLADPDAWDTCSGEPINFLHDDAGTASVEDGSIAKTALEGLNSSPTSACWMLPTAQQLEQALESVPSFHDLSAELIAPAMLEHLREVISAGEYGDAYQGARQDLLIWKRRALEAETKVREQDQVIENLGNALNAESGPTFMGEPVMPASAGEPLPHWEPCNPGCDPDFNGQRSRECAQLCRPAREALSASGGDERAAFWRLVLRPAWSAISDAGDVYLPAVETDYSETMAKWANDVWAAWQARAALSANHSEQVPDGWKLVPVESTGLMDDAAGIGMEKAREVYRAMLAAAPSAGSQGGDA